MSGSAGYPAVRMYDHHFCPSHDGSHVQPPAAPTILIEGQPAARKGDKAWCLSGGDDPIAQGEETILFAGAPAARLGHRTEHRGLLDTGAANVFLGAIPGGAVAEKAKRYADRLALISQARALAATMQPGQAQNDLVAAANRFARNNIAVEHARLTAQSYHPGKPPPGWKEIDLINEDDGTVPGLRIVIYQSEIDGSYVAVFSGTDIWDRSRWQEAVVDMLTGNVQTEAGTSLQQLDAILRTLALQDKYPGLTLAGDSLGGGLATAAAVLTGLPANVFNAAGVSPAYAILSAVPGHDNVNSYRVDGEILALLGLGGPPIGNQYPLDPGDGGHRPMINLPYFMSPLLRLAIGAANMSLDGGAGWDRAMWLHCPPAVEAAIEAQKRADEATIRAALIAASGKGPTP